MAIETIQLAPDRAPMGTRRILRVYRFGASDIRPKVYIHAGVHADETPGMLVAHHLVQRLEQAEQNGEITGQVVVLPYANPIGLSQFVNNEQQGRFDLYTGTNFNRAWPDLSSALIAKVKGQLTDNAGSNTAMIRQAMIELLDAMPIRSELDTLRIAVSREAFDADLVLDLHCDDEALMHLFLKSTHWPDTADLAGELGCRAVLFADAAGGLPFASSVFRPWARLVEAYPDHPVDMACVSATVEFRGYADVSDELAAQDANALFRTLQRRGYIAGDPGPFPQPSCKPTELDACDILHAPRAGIVTYRAGLGEQVHCGEVFAEIVDVSAATPEVIRHPVYAQCDGIVLSRRLRRMVAAGEVIGKVAGTRSLAHRTGDLLED